MNKKYRFLEIGSKIFQVLAWVALVVGTVAGVVIFVGGGTPEAPRPMGFVGIALGIVYFFIFFVASEMIALLLEMRGKLDKGPSQS
jgi:hypothetical protein